MSKKNDKKSATTKKAEAQRANPIIAKFEKMIKSADDKIAKLEQKKTSGLSTEERQKLVDAFEAKVSKMREKFEARLAKNGGEKIVAKVEQLKFEREQYVKALDIFKQPSKTEPKAEEKK